jgi:hypothetical protein
MPFKQDAGLRLGFQAAHVKARRSRIELRIELRNRPKGRKSRKTRGIDASGSHSEKFAQYFGGMCEALLVKLPERLPMDESG